ncbi:hypothetical protein GGX14DRAFT_571129 [Mycena pura]|uniref:Uncharacterized protein n=1 Tax=Mycena pura TaxID=153505 RepID=A0AAD6Y6I7_9AGAR|nr:hypothetical protein GGX14DRAFT_571129 [Mycena pura]
MIKDSVQMRKARCLDHCVSLSQTPPASAAWAVFSIKECARAAEPQSACDSSLLASARSCAFNLSVHTGKIIHVTVLSAPTIVAGPTDRLRFIFCSLVTSYGRDTHPVSQRIKHSRVPSVITTHMRLAPGRCSSASFSVIPSTCSPRLHLVLAPAASQSGRAPPASACFVGSLEVRDALAQADAACAGTVDQVPLALGTV